MTLISVDAQHKPLVFSSRESCEQWLSEVGRRGIPHCRNKSEWIILQPYEGQMFAWGKSRLVFLGYY